MKKRILQLTGARRECLYTRIKSLANATDPNTISRKSSGTNIPHWESWSSVLTQIFVNTEETLYDAQFTLVSTGITGVQSRSFHSHSLVCLPRFPAGSCLSSAEKQKNNRTLDRKLVSEILKRGPLFSNRVRWTKKKTYISLC